MKNRKTFKSDPALKVKEKRSSAMAGLTVKETEQAPPLTGLTQENYIDLHNLGTFTVVDVLNIRFNRLWL
jgi:hypothetical protein